MSNFDNLPDWARPYVPTSDFFNENYSIETLLTSLNDSSNNNPSVAVGEKFTVTFSAKSPTVTKAKKQTQFANNGGTVSRVYENKVTINRPVGVFGVKLEAKNYKIDEIQYARDFPTDSFPLGFVSLNRNGFSIHSQKVQYAKQIVVCQQVLQLIKTTNSANISDFCADSVVGRIYYKEIPVSVSLLTVYESCKIFFESQT